MHKLLIETLAKVRIISGTKSSESLAEIEDRAKVTQDRFKSRIKSASKVTLTQSNQVQVAINDQKVEKDL